MNHVTGWTQDGKPALLISQPHATDFAELAKAGKRTGLEIKINEDGWSGHGTVVIEMRRPKVVRLKQSRGCRKKLLNEVM